MTRSTLLVLCCAGLFASPALAGPAAKPSCCAKPVKQAAAARKVENEKLRCSLTGQVVDKCCCVERAGKLHCTLADKDVASCCCSAAKAEANEAK